MAGTKILCGLLISGSRGMPDYSHIIVRLNECVENSSDVKIRLKNGRIKFGRILHLINDHYIILFKKDLRIQHDMVEVEEIDAIDCI